MRCWIPARRRVNIRNAKTDCFHNLQSTLILTNLKSINFRFMSYGTNFSESWKQPMRLSAEQSIFKTERQSTETRERCQKEDRLPGSRHIFSTIGYSWQPQGQEGPTLATGEEDHVQAEEGPTLATGEEDHAQAEKDSTGSLSFCRPPRQDFDSAERHPVSRPSCSQPNPNPSVPRSQPRNTRQDSSLYDAVPASLRSVQSYARYPVYRVNKYYRSAQALSMATSRNSGEDFNMLTQGTSPFRRYPLRSKHSIAAPITSFQDPSSLLDRSDQMRPRHGFGPVEANAPPFWYVQNQATLPQVSSPSVPTATDLYFAQARLPVIRCGAPKTLLVILDLNGTLLVRPNNVRPREFNVRPGVHQLLDYLFDNHMVMVYSSARPENVKTMVNGLIRKKRAQSLVAIWGRDKLELTPAQYSEKVQTYKKLERVWGDERIQATCKGGQRWSQANTVLIDDNPLKALHQPHNLIQVPEFSKGKLSKEGRRRELEVVASVRAKLEELRWALDVSRHILRWQTGQIEPPRATKLNPLPKSTGERTSEEPIQMDDTPHIVESVEHPEVESGLEKEMRDLTTDPRPGEDIPGMNEPGISAEEWQDFLQ